VVSTEDGRSEAWSWDLASGERRRASEGGVGAEEAHVSPDGLDVVWWFDAVGDERGRWMATPFAGGDPRPLAPTLPEGWMAGLSMVPGATAIGLDTEDGSTVWLLRDGEAPRPLYRHERPAGVGREWPQGEGGLSADGALVCIRHAERSDISHPALRVLDATTGQAVTADIDDPGTRPSPEAWSPIAGDQRLAVTRELGDRRRPWMWEPSAGRLEPIEIDLDGDLTVAGWYPNADALLLARELDARPSLHRFDLGTGVLTTVLETAGTISGVTIRPDGEIWARTEDGVRPPAWRRTDGKDIPSLALTDPPPPGRPWEAVWFANPAGDRIHGWLLRPEGSGPYPTVISVHGGPEYHNTDAYEPRRQALADHGYAVLLVNYRGSTGFGAAFRESLRGNIGFPESEDVNAGLDHLIAQGIADPERVFLEGWSWGGYQATLNAGLRPDRWRAVLAGIPVGDYVAAHYECAPALRAWDLSVMGGDPMDLPELYAERNPMTYVDRVTAPILMIAGTDDSRCPLGQVMVYAHALRARGKAVEVHLYPGGHHANATDEQVRHVELMLEFFGRHGGPPVHPAA
jgi:dipeptidyl aminopeptidase/acylaminoacyl peptidase